ncbi:MAG: glycosyltransferase family 39 protein [Comamonadaceae bacterium]|nr:glycosyltransferase family 39 protein [Comamonadaceae bacterium]
MTAARPSARAWPGWWVGAVLYFAAHALARVTVSPAPELDEAEQLLWTRELAWGYGAQPPLYTWLQWAVFEFVGTSVLGLALLKNALLLAAYAALAWAAVPLVGASAGLVAASMLWLPQIGWESQRDLTHTVLATTLAALALALFVRIALEPRRWHYLAFGAVAGLGLLAKYNLIVFLALLLGTALALPPLRRRVFSRWALAALVVALLVVAPHGIWVLQHLDEVTSGTARKMALDADGGLMARVVGAGNAMRASLSVVAPWALVFGLVVAWPSWRAARTARRAGRDFDESAARTVARRAVLVYFALLALTLAAMALGAGVTQFKGRWLQPMLFLVPLAGWLLLPAPPPAAAERRWMWVTAALAVLLFAGIAFRAPFDGWRGRPDELNEPVAALAQAIRELEPEPAVLVVTPPLLAAGLRLQFPQSRVLRADEHTAASGPTVWVAAGGPADARRLVSGLKGEVHAFTLRPLYVRDNRHARHYAVVVTRN